MKILKIALSVILSVAIFAAADYCLLAYYFAPNTKDVKLAEITMFDEALRTNVNTTSQSLSIKISSVERSAKYYVSQKEAAKKKAAEEKAKQEQEQNQQ